ncbi:MAG: hypothetical protein V3T81_09085 [Thermoanaerobaculia bacterium]
MRSGRPAALLALALAIATGRAEAQFTQYTPPGSFQVQRESTQDRLDQAMKQARWRLGRFYLDPWVGLRDVAYIDDAQTRSAGPEEPDFTATVGAGIRLYRPLGSELTFTAHFLPEYVWWKDLTERRRTNGRYGAGLFGDLGRTGLELTASRTEESRFFSREVEERVNLQDEGIVAALEVSLGAGISLFAGGELRRFRTLDDGEEGVADLRRLDRDEDILRAGIRFNLGKGWEIGLGAERSEVDFESEAADRPNAGTSPILEIDYQGSLLFLGAALAYRDLQPEAGSRFVPYEEVTGRAWLGLRPSGRFEIQLYGSRNLVYSVDQRWVYFEETGYGLGVHLRLRPSINVRLFVEQGTSDYVPFDNGAIDRRDDADTFGGDLEIRFHRRALLTLGASRSDHVSAFPGLDRSITVIRSGFSFGGISPWG